VSAFNSPYPALRRSSTDLLKALQDAHTCASTGTREAGEATHAAREERNSSSSAAVGALQSH